MKSAFAHLLAARRILILMGPELFKPTGAEAVRAIEFQLGIAAQALHFGFR